MGLQALINPEMYPLRTGTGRRKIIIMKVVGQSAADFRNLFFHPPCRYPGMLYIAFHKNIGFIK